MAFLKNRGEFEPKGGITMSFPQRPLLDYSVRFNDFKELKRYKIGERIYNNHKNQKSWMEAIHPIIETNDSNWSKGEAHHFSIVLTTPDDIQRLRIRVRGALTLNRVVPIDGVIDQQAFACREISIDILD